MSTATITSKGQISLPRDVRVRPVTGAVDELFGMLRRPGAPPRSLEEIEGGIGALAREEDERVRRGEE